jgi:hypothetical protein
MLKFAPCALPCLAFAGDLARRQNRRTATLNLDGLAFAGNLARRQNRRTATLNLDGPAFAADLARRQNRRTATPFWLEAQGRPVGWPTLGDLEKAFLPQRGYGQPRLTIPPATTRYGVERARSTHPG